MFGFVYFHSRETMWRRKINDNYHIKERKGAYPSIHIDFLCTQQHICLCMGWIPVYILSPPWRPVLLSEAVVQDTNRRAQETDDDVPINEMVAPMPHSFVRAQA
jgi:hypothetical protein